MKGTAEAFIAFVCETSCQVKFFRSVTNKQTPVSKWSIPTLFPKPFHGSFTTNTANSSPKIFLLYSALMKYGFNSLHWKHSECLCHIYGRFGWFVWLIQVKRLCCMLTMQLAMKLHKHQATLAELQKTSSQFPEGDPEDESNKCGPQSLITMCMQQKTCINTQ